MTKSTAFSYIYPQLIATHDSKHNQEVKIYKFTGKYFVSVSNLTQSGGLVTKIWKKVVDHIDSVTFNDEQPKNILILGLGAGSAVDYICQTWSKCQIDGLEIDPVMISMGKRYFQLENYSQLNIVNTDAFIWLKENTEKYDVILIDMYQGRQVPKLAETIAFLKSIQNHLSKRGVAVFNRLLIKEQKDNNLVFLDKLHQQFSKVERIKTPVNKVYLVEKN